MKLRDEERHNAAAQARNVPTHDAQGCRLFWPEILLAPCQPNDSTPFEQPLFGVRRDGKIF